MYTYVDICIPSRLLVNRFDLDVTLKLLKVVLIMVASETFTGYIVSKSEQHNLSIYYS